jgi:hypothetical protein
MPIQFQTDSFKQQHFSNLQLFIAEVTLFFNKQDLDLAIGLSLTIMLVMYTMYQSISQSLPQTAYLKFIDIWLMFCLLVPFFVFVVQVSISPTLSARLFCAKVLCKAFVYLDLRFVLFGAKISAQKLHVIYW